VNVTKRQQNSFWFQSNTTVCFYFYLVNMFRPIDQHPAVFESDARSANSIHAIWDPITFRNILKHITKCIK